MLLYLDSCCFNRPYDDQSMLSISLETQAKIHIQSEIIEERFTLLWSYILDYENSRNPFEDQRKAIQEWKAISIATITESDEIIAFGNSLVDRGLHTYDALHIACAYIGGCDRFLTVDKGILSKPITEIHVCNPIDFIRELMN